MENSEEKRRKRRALIATLVFHAVALLLFMFFGLKQPVPLPEEAGASIEFGWDESASGQAMADIQTPAPIPEVAAPEPQETPVENVAEDPVATDDQSDIAVPEEPEEKPKPKPETPKPQPKPEEPKPTLNNELSNALDALKNAGGGGSQGDKQGEGNQGNPQGTTGDGALGNGLGSWKLDGRSMMAGYGTQIKTTTEEGIVVLDIWVDQSGKVTKVSPNLKESNTTSQYLISLATNDVLKNYRFNGDPRAQIEQRGMVRYVFQLK